MKKIVILMICTAGILLNQTAYARVQEPASVPDSLKGIEPHKPSVSIYYLQRLVNEGKMTPQEMESTQVYMIFRNARRMGDLESVKNMNQEERRAYMKYHRRLRGNPLKEYADYCGMTYERARDLMNSMHESDKGTQYYQELQRSFEINHQ